jgi:hypothetical protein
LEPSVSPKSITERATNRSIDIATSSVIPAYPKIPVIRPAQFGMGYDYPTVAANARRISITRSGSSTKISPSIRVDNFLTVGTLIFPRKFQF